MKIAGFLGTSTLDYPEHLAAVVFTYGCNYDCGFCHNPELLGPTRTSFYKEKEIILELENRRHFITGVVITGGEPTIHKDLLEFMEKVRDLGYAVKLDTNGSNPDVVAKALDWELVNYVSVDLKASIDKYSEVTGMPKVNVRNVINTISYLQKSSINYEVRTTVVPTLTLDDFRSMAPIIRESSKYVLQKFNPEKTNKNSYLGMEALNIEEIKTYVETFLDYEVQIRK